MTIFGTSLAAMRSPTPYKVHIADIDCEMLAPVTYWGDVWYAMH